MSEPPVTEQPTALAGAARRHAAQARYLRAWETCELSGLRSRPVVVPAGSGQPVAA